MKILILQLARLGDVYQTWPVLRALKRTHPESEIHILVRKRFLEATQGIASICTPKVFDTEWLLEPCIADEPSEAEALERLTAWTMSLVEERYDKVINLTFSPFSSYLSQLVSSGLSEVRGYTRQHDGTLAIPDDTSAYFYAQVGIHKKNRFHIDEIFGAIAGVDFIESDWGTARTQKLSEQPKIVLHMGASQAFKTLSASKWSSIIKRLLEDTNSHVTLIGSAAEESTAREVAIGQDQSRILNQVGKTTLAETFELIRSATLIVGGDSSPMHMATLTSTPALNLSIGDVNFWETGPMSIGSRVMRIEDPDAVTSEDIVNEIKSMVAGVAGASSVYHLLDRAIGYVSADKIYENDFSWALIKAIYQGAGFPEPKTPQIWSGLERMNEVNTLALEQIEMLTKTPQNRVAAAILERADEMLRTIAKISPELDPLIQWFFTEKVRIAPGTFASVVEATRKAHQQLQNIIVFYVGESPTIQEEVPRDNDHNLKV